MSASGHGESKVALLRRVRRVVVKIGSRPLSGRRGINRARLQALVEEIADLHDRGLEVVLVTSGALAAGCVKLGFRERPQLIPQRQAAAAVGQIDLMALYQEYFAAAGKHVAQVLLTHDDLANRRRYINAKHTLETLLQARVIPITNENDTVAVEELNFGDNDNLSALVATLIEADLLVILSDVAGLYTQDPRGHPEATVIPFLHADDAEPAFYATSVSGPLGTGGMTAKLSAARKASAAGIPTIIADGLNETILSQLFDPHLDAGTLILPAGDRLALRKHWIAYILRPRGSLRLDPGAYRAVCGGGRSLLPGGIQEVQGEFDAGDCVQCLNPEGKAFAHGLANYSAADLERIKGLRTSQIESVLGYKIKDEVIHRDDLVLLRPPG